MSKATEQNDKLKRAIIISVVLHILLIALLIWSSFDENIDASAGGGGGDIDAVMVDPGAVVDQYNRQQNQQADSQQANQQRQKQAQQQAEELQQKQAAEQQRLKELAQERLQAQEDAKQQAEQQAEQQRQAEQAAKQAQEQQKAAEAAAAKAKADAKAQADAQAKAAADAKAKAEAKAKADAEAKSKADAEKKAAAAAKAKAAAAAKAKAAAEAKQETGEVDDLLGGLASGKNAPKQGKGGAAAGPGNQNKSGANGADVSNYAGQIQSAIQSKFYDWESFKGKECTLRVRLAPNGGMLIDVQAQGGDPALCQAALSAARQANIPKPPSQAVYEALKNAPVDFKPQ